MQDEITEQLTKLKDKHKTIAESLDKITEEYETQTSPGKIAMEIVAYKNNLDLLKQQANEIIAMLRNKRKDPTELF